MRAIGSILPIIALSTLLLLSSFALAETIEGERVVPEVRATKINPHPPKLDGFLDDDIWHKPDLQIIKDFTQRMPNEGQPASESTHVAVVYDDEALYVAFWVYESDPSRIQKQLVRRDRYGEADRVAVRLDPYHDHLTGYGFEINCSGVMIDYTISNDSWTDDSWDGVWQSHVQMQPWGWSAEVKIPFSCLRFTEQENPTWGIDFARWITHNNESNRWAFMPVKNAGFASNFGHLTGIQGITPPAHLEIMPYTVTSLETEPKSAGNIDGRDIYKNMGVDVKYGVSSNLTLDVTVNPDFGQVELDGPVLNLTAFETYFSERRPFFVEGSSMFSTEFDLFYSRRIGRQPRGRISDDGYDYTTDAPKATSILTAAKLTGKLSGGTSIAVLNAVTANEYEEYKTVSGEDKKGLVEPKANYSVFRLKQDIFKNSAIGVMFTNAGQDQYHPSTTGGFDWRLQSNNADWIISGQTIFNRNDAFNTGFGFYNEIAKNGGKHWRGSIYAGIKDRYFDLNTLGFNGRNSYRNCGFWVQYQTAEPWWIFRRTWNNINGYFGWNYDGYNITKGGNHNFSIEFTNYWSLSGGIEVQADEYEDYETRGNGIWQWPDNPTYSFWMSFNTDTRKKWILALNPGAGQDREGTWWAHYTGMTIRPASNIEIDLGSNVSRSFKATRWVTNNAGRSIFGTLDKDQISPTISANVLFNRNLSLQISAETLIAGLDYRDFREYGGGRTYIPLDPVEDSTLLKNLQSRDYNYSAINSSMLLRWEYMPGSTLFLVWTRARDEIDFANNDLDVNRDLKRLFSAGSYNVFLVKISYWWNA